MKLKFSSCIVLCMGDIWEASVVPHKLSNTHTHIPLPLVWEAHLSLSRKQEGIYFDLVPFHQNVQSPHMYIQYFTPLEEVNSNLEAKL